MKNEHRGNTAPYVRYKISDLLAYIETEFKYAMECYEDGTLSPQRSFQHIKQELEEIKELIGPAPSYSYLYHISDISSCTQPPATPEAL